MRLSLHRLSPVKNIFLIIEKEEDDSRFRSTNIAQCAEKVSSSSSFFYNSNSFSQTKVYPAKVPLQLFLQQLLAIQIEEYVPEIIPTISASKKYLSVAPPKKRSATSTITVVKEVFIERSKVE